MAKKSEADQLTFEEAMANLEAIVRELEEGQIGLEESLTRYEQGARLIQSCYAQLRDAEQRIQLLTGVDEKSQPLLKPFQHEATFAAPPKLRSD